MTVIHFHEQIRCKDARLQRKLDGLRTAVPSVRQLKDILRGRRAWKTAEPTAWDVLELLRSFPHTTIVTCTRGASALVNSLAAKVLFHDRHKNPLGVIPMDYDANEANFEAHGRLQKARWSPAVLRSSRASASSSLGTSTRGTTLSRHACCGREL